MGQDYKSSGVDEQSAASWVERIAQRFAADQSVLKQKIRSAIGHYAAIYELHPQRWIALSCDGVGTKLIWTQKGLGRFEDLAQDLLAMNANDILCVGARPILFLDYLAVGSSDFLKTSGAFEAFMSGLFAACASTGQLLVGGETAQMPDLYAKDDFDLAGFSLGEMAPQDYLDPRRLQSGAELWGWPSSGPHSNGFSWLRKIFDPQKDSSFIREQLMLPTRLYVNEMSALKALLLDCQQPEVLLAAYHITGNGLLNLLRLQPDNASIGFDLHAWPALPEWCVQVQKRSGASLAQLAETFNVGIGFCVLLDKVFATQQRSALQALGLKYLGESVGQRLVHWSNITLL